MLYDAQPLGKIVQKMGKKLVFRFLSMKLMQNYRNIPMKAKIIAHQWSVDKQH
ncbi:hypothetical protein CORMATOL_01814 [Corynebacterium matruchotii ATCC 33806]|uniref:Uncharacterized protein n=1 Tax=Corynebacterium matruchotii ATCC 33806 TaxID=566549 RepID=C0E493_9CORY|nr:hypothetical protein CORMATOL_01814 [Corynebacterium matruchotii ATCC 33806]